MLVCSDFSYCFGIRKREQIPMKSTDNDIAKHKINRSCFNILDLILFINGFGLFFLYFECRFIIGLYASYCRE